MKSLVLEEKLRLSLRDFPLSEILGSRDVRIAIRTVGICGSDLHYYLHGAIGPYVVRQPMILGHEAAGIVIETGSEVSHLAVGDRVCMEPGIPDPTGRATALGLYNLDPRVRFWATPPVHGCLRTTVVHPAAFTFRLPAQVALEEGAMVEPLAVGIHAANKARIRPGDIAVVIGAGPIGILTALAALAGGCSKVFLTDIHSIKLAAAASYPGIIAVNVTQENIVARVKAETEDWGADLVFDASGSARAIHDIFSLLCPGGCAVLIGIPEAPVPFDIVAAQAKEARVESVFRYAHVFPRAIALMASGKLDVKPLITDRFAFDDAVAAFQFAGQNPPASIKIQIHLPE
jgi:D-xylulose reductase